MGEYIPQAPINDEAKKNNKNLPGMGGIYNTVNMHVYHYAGNNPIKLVDPDGRDIDSLLVEAQSKIYEAIASNKDEIKKFIESSSARGEVKLYEKTFESGGKKYRVSLNLVFEATGEGNSSVKLIAGADIFLNESNGSAVTVGLRQSFDIYNSKTGTAIWDSKKLSDHVGSLKLAVNGKVYIGDNLYATVEGRKYLINVGKLDLSNKGLRDLAFKDWEIGYKYSFGIISGGGRFNVSKYFGYN